jgi:hypothetical protein
MFILNRRSAAGLLALSLLAGCKDALGPGSVDVASLSANVATMTAVFTNSASLQDLAGLAPSLPLFSPVAGFRMTLGPISHQALVARGAAARSLVRSLSASPQGLFPTTVLGKTLAWDTASHTYLVDNTLTGAPANGVRILIYSANILNSQPSLPLHQTGYLELTDESAGQVSTLGVRLAQGTTMVVDYAVTFARIVAGSDTTIAIVSAGFINDPAGPGRVDFVFGDTLGSARLVFAGQLTASDGSQLQASVRENSNSAELSVFVSKGGNGIALDLISAAFLTGTVNFNGVTVATISGDPNAPTFTAANGHTLTSAQTSGLLEIFGGALLVIGDLTSFVLTPAILVFHG